MILLMYFILDIIFVECHVIRCNYKTGLQIAGVFYRISQLHLENIGKARLLAIFDFHNFFSK